MNSAWPIAWTGEVDLGAAVDHVEGWYRQRAMPAWFRLAEGLTAPLELSATLTARGYSPDTHTLVMTRPLAASDGDAAVVIESSPTEDFLAPMRVDAPSDADYAERRDVLLRAPAPRALARLPLDDRPAAVGASVVTGDLALIFLMRTASWARRRGLARRVLRALTGWAHDSGARTAFLQVEAANGPAVALYEGEGFATAYSYVYWRPRST